MPKKKGTNTTPETPEENTTEEAQEEQEASTDNKLAKDLPELARRIGSTDAFLDRYAKRIAAVDRDMPSRESMRDMLASLPEEHQEAVATIMRRMSSDKKGVYSADDRPDYTELRLYQGTGADPNRPDSAVPGQFYLTSKENVGKVFEGTVIAIWQGRTMWPSRDGGGGGARMPVCISMDRKVGSRFGNCSECYNLPFRNGQATDCSDDVVAFMLTRDLQDIVLVRFSRTSEPAGRQLMRFIKKSMVPWEKWFKIETEEHKNKESGYRWFTMSVNLVEEDGKAAFVDTDLYDFCEAMCTNAEASYILPGIGRIYSQAEDAYEEAKEEDDADGPKPMAKKAGAPDYDDIEDAPDSV